jgi:hypothetical protein
MPEDDTGGDLAVRRIVLIDGPAVLGWQEWRRIDSRYVFAMVRAALAANAAAGSDPQARRGRRASIVQRIPAIGSGS